MVVSSHANVASIASQRLRRKYKLFYTKLSCLEAFMDWQGSFNKTMAWLHGLWLRGRAGAHDAAFGLTIASTA